MGSVLDINGAEPEDEFTDELKPGTTLLQRQYTIESFLKVGGFGLTYLARDSLDRTVVVKECFPGTLCSRSRQIVRARSRAHQEEFRSVVRLFVQEARRLAKVRHPNIVGVHQVFEDNETAYMALDYIRGDDLLDIIEEGRNRLDPAQITEMLERLLQAIGFVHDHGLLHRDISPDNILIDDQTGAPVLIDFGAAREQATKTSRVLSALQVVKDGYSPQEFYISNGPQGPSSDLYSLGATFYHLLTGEAPPNSQLRLAAVAARDADPYRPLAGRVEGYAPEFLRAIDTAMNLFQKDRYQTAHVWLAEIDVKRRRAEALEQARIDARIDVELSQLVAETNEAVQNARWQEEQKARETAKKPVVETKKKPFFPWQLEEGWMHGDSAGRRTGTAPAAAASRELKPVKPLRPGNPFKGLGAAPAAAASPTPPQQAKDTRRTRLWGTLGKNLKARLWT